MSLLSDKDKEEIRRAIKSVTDTFMVSPVNYQLRKSVPDRWGEGDTDTFITHLFDALVEYKDTDQSVSLEGFEDDFDVKLTLNVEDMLVMGLYDPSLNLPMFKATDDFFTVKGANYRVNYVGLDGPLDSQDVLIIITGIREETAS